MHFLHLFRNKHNGLPSVVYICAVFPAAPFILQCSKNDSLTGGYENNKTGFVCCDNGSLKNDLYTFVCAVLHPRH